jgi:uncharacterized protein (TIGR03545 family)
MFRYSYLIPRLVMLLALCLFLQYGLDPCLTLLFRQVGQSAVGAKVDIGRIQSALLHGRLHLMDVQIADPKSPQKNLIEFERASFQLNNRALRARRFVVQEGAISGIAFGTLRDESGQLERIPEEDTVSDSSLANYRDQWLRDAGDEAQLWFDDLQKRLEADLRDEFESIPLAEQLRERWTAEYERRRLEVDQWEDRIKGYRQLTESIRRDPLRHLPSLPQHLQEVERLMAEIDGFRGDLIGLGQQVEADRAAVERAKEHDLQRVKELTRLDQIDPTALSEYLLSEQLAERVELLRGWIDRGRQMFDLVLRPPALNQHRSRGVDFVFGGEDYPTLLIERLALSGQFATGGEMVEFAGFATDITHQPKRLGRPAVLEFNTRGSIVAQVRAEADRTTLRPRYRYTIRCPRLRQPTTQLGDPRQFAVALAEGNGALWCDIHVEDDQVAGEIRWRQDDVHVTPDLTSKRASFAVGALEEGFSEIRQLHAVVTMGGSLDRPQFRVRSNLGPQVARGLRLAAERQLGQLQADLAGRLEAEVADELRSIEDLVKRREAAVRDVIASVTALRGQFMQQPNVPVNVFQTQNPLRRFFE